MRGEYRYQLTATFGLEPEERYEKAKRYTKGVRYVVDTVILTEQFPPLAGDRGPLVSLRGYRVTKAATLGSRVHEDWLRIDEADLPIEVHEEIAQRVSNWQHAVAS